MNWWMGGGGEKTTVRPLSVEAEEFSLRTGSSDDSSGDDLPSRTGPGKIV